jgi:hypothetical protein
MGTMWELLKKKIRRCGSIMRVKTGSRKDGESRAAQNECHQSFPFHSIPVFFSHSFFIPFHSGYQLSERVFFFTAGLVVELNWFRTGL